MKKSLRASIGLLLFLSVGTLLYSGFAPLSDGYLIQSLQQEPLQLQVQPLQQQTSTSCGEAAITMAYNYIHPEAPLNELDVIQYATTNNYYIKEPPFTSPANMLKIAQHYSNKINHGNVMTSDRGLALLIQKLQANEPVIIDVITRLNDSDSGAHFVVVTGVSLDPTNKDVVLIHYNNPQTGRAESARWDGEGGLWNAWQNNPDPGGSGWWMTLPAPK